MEPTATQLDLRGEMCPYPLQQTKAAVNDLEAGGVVRVLIDCPDAVGNLTNWAGHAGHTILETLTLGPAEWSLTLQKS
ncbi:MAG: sulfurtransferase TusA family protein [Proteobacteria bacterium]|nr:sulfurtransferase TusA family protein [Pseudomonadota bacterium]